MQFDEKTKTAILAPTKCGSVAIEMHLRTRGWYLITPRHRWDITHEFEAYDRVLVIRHPVRRVISMHWLSRLSARPHFLRGVAPFGEYLRRLAEIRAADEEQGLDRAWLLHDPRDKRLWTSRLHEYLPRWRPTTVWRQETDLGWVPWNIANQDRTYTGARRSKENAGPRGEESVRLAVAEIMDDPWAKQWLWDHCAEDAKQLNYDMEDVHLW